MTDFSHILGRLSDDEKRALCRHLMRKGYGHGVIEGIAWGEATDHIQACLKNSGRFKHVEMESFRRNRMHDLWDATWVLVPDYRVEVFISYHAKAAHKPAEFIKQTLEVLECAAARRTPTSPKALTLVVDVSITVSKDKHAHHYI